MRPTPIYTPGRIRAIERSAAGAIPPLMERAGLAAAEHARRVMPAQARRVLVVAGPGNNGGDAFEVAAHLARWFWAVDLVFAGERKGLSPEARAALAKCKAAGLRPLDAIPDGRRWDFVVDGLFGIGLARALEGRYAALVSRINSLGAPVLALDVPSGLNADTGAVMGEAVRAAHTVTFIALKPGLLMLDGPDCAGVLRVEPIGLERETSVASGDGALLDESSLTAALARRPANFHKGMAGSVLVLGGADAMVGAALLAGRAALACGAGRVHVALLAESAPAVDFAQPELMLHSPDRVSFDDAATAVAAGPGLGRSAHAAELLARAIACAGPLVLDADALNAISEDTTLAQRVTARSASTLLTPHPAEAARLLGCTTPEVQADRLAAARRLAERYRAAVALKGNGTVIAEPGGRWWINPTGNPGMATAGMGDALTGLTAGLLAQGAAGVPALCAAVWLHGEAGDRMAARAGGPLGLTASEVIEEAKRELNRTIYRS